MMWFDGFLLLIGVYFIYRLVKFWIIDPWRIHRDLWSQGIPGHYIPIVGDILQIRRAILADDPFIYHRSLMKKYDGYYHSSFGPIARLIISDPSLIQGVLKTNARCYHKANIMRNILGVMLGDRNLIMAEDLVHSQHRRLIFPVFQHQNLNSMISLMVRITSDLINRWISQFNQTNPSILLDVQKEMANLTLDIVTGCVFGSGMMKNDDVKEIIYHNVTTTLEDVEQRTFNLIGIIPIINQLPLPSKLRIDRSKKDVRRVIQNIIDERKKGLTQSACKGADLLDLLLSAHGQEKNQQLTDEDLFEEALTFVIAGHETTSNLMTWTLFNLCHNPDVCHRLEEEIDSVLHDRVEFDFSTLSLLNYTELVLKESLRLHQPVPAIVRTTVEDNTLVASDGKEIHLKKGTDLLINFYGLHHSDKYWEDPYTFNPLRFLQRHTETFLPFSAGPRSCIGQNFAMLEAKVMLAMLIQRFSFELVPGQKHVPEIAITMRPKYGMWMKITPRIK